jgi:hypothetical protein
MKTLISLILIAAFLTGCTTPTSSSSKSSTAISDPSEHWIKGTLSCLENGSVLSFRIQKKMAWGGSATGGVVAINSITGQRFTGQYTGMMDSGHINSWANADAWGTGGYATASATGYTHWQSEMANAAATLTDQSTNIIQLQMQIHAGWSPHGIGRGIDNQGRHYQLQF